MIDESLKRILHLLADGEIHSGQELGDVLGVSRTAVWKHLQKLEALEVSLEPIKGKGYRVRGGLDLLKPEDIRAQMNPQVQELLSALDVHTVIESTNTYTMQNGSRLSNGYVCLAEQQTAGKGRRGRQWVSPFGKNIYLSIFWTFDGVAALEGLSLAIGVAIVDALSECGIEAVQLKWPNDVLWQQKKLAGILLEMTGDPAGLCQVVVGIGINVSMSPANAKRIDQPWTDIETILATSNSQRVITRDALVAKLLTHVLPLLQNYSNDRFIAYRLRWEALNAYAYQPVELHTPKEIIVGTLLGVDEAGALRLETTDGEARFYGGEISVRTRNDSPG